MFVHVIGTLRLSEDQACQMTAEFYTTLSNTDNIALSYRTAIMGLIIKEAFATHVLRTIYSLGA